MVKEKKEEEEEECYAADRSARACTVNDLLGYHFSKGIQQLPHAAACSHLHDPREDLSASMAVPI